MFRNAYETDAQRLARRADCGGRNGPRARGDFCGRDTSIKVNFAPPIDRDLFLRRRVYRVTFSSDSSAAPGLL